MNYLRKLRQEKGLSIKKLSKETGVGEITISNIENNNYKKISDKARKLAAYFNVNDPKKLTKNTTKMIKNKKCLNQRCLLNKECFCQSPIVTTGKDFCKSENVVSKPIKKLK